MKKLHIVTVLLVALALAACGAPPATSAPAAAPAPATEVPAVEPTVTEPMAEPMPEAATSLAIVATANGYEAPELVSSGWVEVSLMNQGDARRQAAIFRLEEGNTVEDLGAALQSGEPGLPRFLTAVGGPAGVMPGATGAVVIELEPGSYVILDPEPDATGVPALASGFLLPFTVADEANDNAEPVAGMTISMVDYLFEVDAEAVPAGTTTIQFVNHGPMEAHEVALIKLNDGASVQDFLAATSPDAPPGPPPGQGVGGLSAIAVEKDAYLTVELEAGATYGLICFLPSGANHGAPHFTLGMVTQFSVPAE